MMNMETTRSSQSGFTLIEAVIAAIIIAIAGMGTGAMLKYSMAVERDFNRMSQIEILRRTLRTEFNCRKSLDINPAAALPQVQACSRGNKTVDILNREGVELFSMHTSGEYYRVGDWHLRARCQNSQIVFDARMNQRGDPRKSEADALFGGWRDLFSGTSRFCQEYLSPSLSRCAAAPYTEMSGWDSRGAVCCRTVVAVGNGSASATCAPYEVMVSGGAQCTNALGGSALFGVGVSRQVVKQRLQGPGLGNTKGTKTTTAPPMVPHFFFPGADVIADILSPWENRQVRRGGFLVASFPTTDRNNTLSSWEAVCRADDSLSTFPSTAYALCCPKRW
jgi:hypothetical protein